MTIDTAPEHVPCAPPTERASAGPGYRLIAMGTSRGSSHARAMQPAGRRPPAGRRSEPAARAHQPERDQLAAVLVAQAEPLGVELGPAALAVARVFAARGVMLAPRPPPRPPSPRARRRA